MRGMISPSLRGRIAPFLVMDVMEAAAKAEREGRKVLHLEVGQPSTPAPRVVLDAAHAALERETIGYSVALGLPELRARIAQHYRDFYGVDVSEEAVVVTPGASGAFVLAFLAAFDAKAEVACARPGYPCYRNILQALDLTAVEIETSLESGYQITPEDLRKLPRKPAGLILASPANPTGTVTPPDLLAELARYCDTEGIVLISDEIYHGLVYGGACADTTLRNNPRSIVVNSFSKYFSMTGWRLGWMLVPPGLRRSVEILAQNLLICAPTLSQLAARAAFDAHDELREHVHRYDTNRVRLLAALERVGVERIAPADGAFYVYADVSRFTDDSRVLCQRILEEVCVATTPGVDFDPIEGRRMMRLSYCASEAHVEDAAHRLEAFFRGARASSPRLL